MSGNKARHTRNNSAQVSYCSFLSFAGLVVLAGEFYPIPFRTRPSKPPAPMVLRLKPRESRSLPVLPRTEIEYGLARESKTPAITTCESPAREISRGFL